MSAPSTVDSSSEKDEGTLEQRLGKISHEKLVQEVISVWDEVMKMEQELVISRQRTRALELELASLDLEQGDAASISDLEEQLRIMKIRYNQLENKLENEKIRRIDGGGISEVRAQELQDENARLLKVEEEQMMLILDMEAQIDRLLTTIKNSQLFIFDINPVNTSCKAFASSKDSVKLPVIIQSAPASEAIFAVSPSLIPPPTTIVRSHASLAALINSGETGF